jgi:hypothetical protein
MTVGDAASVAFAGPAIDAGGISHGLSHGSAMSRWMHPAVVVGLVLLHSVASWGECADPAPLTGTAVDRALREGVSVVREHAAARETLDNLATTQRVACWLDRRIDPSSPVTLQLQQTPLLLVFEAIAGQLDAACGRLGDTLLIGRSEEIDPLLTQAERLSNQLKMDRSVPAARRLELTRGRAVSWSDLDRPADILQSAAKLWGLTITNVDAVPHDLWAAGSIAGVDASEALSLVLGQFDLSFEWGPEVKSITIMPMPQGITVERGHRPKSLSSTEAEAAIQTVSPEAVVSQRGTSLLVTATVLQHDAIARRLGEVDLPAAVKTTSVPLARRKFTEVKILRKPAGEVLQALIAQRLPLKYDAAALTADGVDLTKLITLEFEQVTAEDLIAAVCTQAGLTYTIEGETVRLQAQPKK